MSSSNNNNSSNSQSNIHEGDRVSFNIGDNTGLTGTVTEVLTKPSEVDGRIAHASKDEPRVAIQYDGTGREVIRTMETVEKINDNQGGQRGAQAGNQSEFQEGDRVSFNIGQNQLQGTVTEVLTRPGEVGGRIAHATPNEPRVAIHMDGSGGDVIRTIEAVEKMDEKQGQSSSLQSSSSKQGGQSEEGQVHEGDRVAFNIGQNILEGTVTEVLTKPSEVDGRIAHASKDEPRVSIEYDGTGNHVIRTLDGIERLNKEGSPIGSDEIQKGDKVAFHIGQNRLEGTVHEILTSPSEVGGRTAQASKEEPRYVIHYDATGTDLIRTEGDVEKIDESERMSTDSSGKRKRQEDEDAGSNNNNKGKQSDSNKKQKSSKSGSSGGRRKGTTSSH